MSKYVIKMAMSVDIDKRGHKATRMMKYDVVGTGISRMGLTAVVLERPGGVATQISRGGAMTQERREADMTQERRRAVIR